MTEAQFDKLYAATCLLYLKAVIYAARIETPNVSDNEMTQVETQLCQAAKTFVHVVDSIDPKLWEPPSTIIQESKTP